MADISAVVATDGVTYNLKDATARERLVPTGGTTGQVLTKTASGYDWQTGGGGGSTVWGDITGTLSNQTDLQAELGTVQTSIDLVSDDVGLVTSRFNSFTNANEGITKVISVSGWSATTTQINGVDYYTYTQVIRSSYSYHDIPTDTPIIGLQASEGNTLPTVAEQKAYDTWDYATYDVVYPTTTLTLYSKSVPSSNFTIVIKGY